MTRPATEQMSVVVQGPVVATPSPFFDGRPVTRPVCESVRRWLRRAPA